MSNNSNTGPYSDSKTIRDPKPEQFDEWIKKGYHPIYPIDIHEEVPGEVKCPKDGTTVTPPGKFCPICGTEVKSTPITKTMLQVTFVKYAPPAPDPKYDWAYHRPKRDGRENMEELLAQGYEVDGKPLADIIYMKRPKKALP